MLGLHHSTACKDEELTVTIQPGLHHTAIWSDIFWPVNPYFWSFHFFFFSPHTHHTTYSGMHWLLVTTQENERKVRKSLRKRRKTCVTIIVGNRTRNLSIGNRCTYHCTIWDTHTHTDRQTYTHILVLVAHYQNSSRGSPRERGERLERNLGKMTQLAIEPPNGRNPLKSPKLWLDLKMIPLMGSPQVSKWARTRCRKKIDGIRVSVP